MMFKTRIGLWNLTMFCMEKNSINRFALTKYKPFREEKAEGGKIFFKSTLFGFLFYFQSLWIPVYSSSAPATKMPLNALWMHRLTPPWMGWMSPPAHLQLQVIIGVWSTAPSCQISCWHQMWPRENEAGAECFPAINLVSYVPSIYCCLGEHQERRC